jgi:GT2 family glycosyltransferase
LLLDETRVNSSTLVKVTIAIPTYNRREKLRRLLNSIRASTFRDYEVVVVDDASSDGTREMIMEEFQDVVYIRHESPTLVAKSRNDAIEASRGDYIFFVDDDNVVEPTTVARLVDFMEKNEDVGTAAPVTCWYSNPRKVMYAGAVFSPFMRRTVFLYAGTDCRELEGKVIEVDTFANSYMFRREAVKKAGLIPWKRFPFINEDGYLQYKIKRLGYRNVTLGSARVYHDINPREGARRSNDMRLYYSMRAKIFFHQDFDPPLRRVGLNISLPVYTAYYMWVARRGGRGVAPVLRGLLDGIMGREGLQYV